MNKDSNETYPYTIYAEHRILSLTTNGRRYCSYSVSLAVFFKFDCVSKSISVNMTLFRKMYPFM